MNQLMTILTHRELFLLLFGSITYAVLFVLTVQNSRRKILLLRQRLQKVHDLQEEQQAKSQERIAQNRRKIAELEGLLQKMGDENSMLRLELEEKKARLDYANKLAIIENERRGQAEATIFGSGVYLHMKQLVAAGHCMSEADWQQLAASVNQVYTGFAEKLYGLYQMSEQEFRVCLLIKVRVPPKDIATLTAHSKASVATTRSRLFQRVFGRKGASGEWDEFIWSL